MPSLTNVLAGIPGYAGYIAAGQLGQERQVGELQQAAGAQGLLASIAEQAQKRQALAKQKDYESAVAALGPNPDQASLAAIASKYAAPDKVMATHTASLDRQATTDATRAAREATITSQAQTAQMQHEYRMRSAATDEARAAEVARHNSEMERLRGELNKITATKATTAASPKAPTGFRYKADGSQELEPIPGGPKDTSGKDVAKAKGAIQKADTVINAVDEALTQTGRFTTGLPGAVLGAIPGTAAYDLDGTLDTIKANLGFTELQAMRDASPTGGALGQVAIQELAMLQSTLASLKRGLGREKLESGLNKVRLHMENWKKAVNEANASAPTEPTAPSAPIASQFREGQTATGQGGQKIIFKGGKWQPIQ